MISVLWRATKMPWESGVRHRRKPAAPSSTQWAIRMRNHPIRRGTFKRLSRPAEITLEDGAVLPVDLFLPQDLPLGYHKLRYRDGEREIRLIVSPGRCYLPERLRIWG